MHGVVADTHAAVWYLTGAPKISTVAVERMRHSVLEGDGILVPSICLVEIVYLLEKGRIPAESWERLAQALETPESGYRVVPLDDAIARAVSRVPRAEVPELPDRIIAATALHLGLPLVTRDRKIQATSIETIW